ncbi:MAG TPA: HAMP domain-containing sensor histidine kinase [Anaerolineales bacterium]|nr:HAMP domain-containing sensor histidine kinase [Anaerolineales bacterium]
MFSSLRNRLILSHILPVLLIIPLTGLAMAYVLETRLLLPMVYRSLADDATLMAAITGDQPLFWQNPRLAQALVDGVEPHLSGQLSVLSLDGHVLAGTQPPTTQTQVVELPDMRGVGAGQTVQIRQGPLAEAYAPAFDSSGKLTGVIRMTTRLVTVSDTIYQLRYLLGAVLLLGVLAGTGLGSYLAFQINRPIQRVTTSIQSLAMGNWQAHAPEVGGPQEMRALAMAVNALVDRLGSLEKARRQLLANLVHELGRPLGAMRSAILALLQGADKDPQLKSDLLQGLDGETVRLKRLLDDLARLHDEVLGGLEINKVRTAPDAWIAGQLPAWEAAAREKGLSWDVDVQPGMPAVEMDVDRIGQALGNLLSNAIKFTTAGGRVSTRAWVGAGRFCVRVTDTGPGIPPEERGRIFQPFYRGARGHRVVEGMGLGLNIARDIALAHGGDITFESQPGQGSAFTLWVPVQA